MAIDRIIYGILTACFLAVVSPSIPAVADNSRMYSAAGFFQIDGTGRTVEPMNGEWLFFKGDADGAFAVGYDDSKWKQVSLPHGIEYLPEEASGCVNYQGHVWYRKHFTPSESMSGKKVFLHFEAVMGKCRIWLNGRQVAEHYGGYLPVIADISGNILPGQDNVVAVLADNSDDPLVPPGKPQKELDFAYFGGIYRDCWLVAHNDVYITDQMYEDEVAGGGVFISFGSISETSADINVKVHVRNTSRQAFSGRVHCRLSDCSGSEVCSAFSGIRIDGSGDVCAEMAFAVENPHLWSPESPYLYRLEVYVEDKAGKPVDGYMLRTGIRSVEFRGEKGFFLNGKKYDGKLIGANRHQDFAVIGNALPNSMHWRDALKLRRAGFKVIRNAHYPQDPAFMDACDSLGLFVIENTPGWQFWSPDPIFAGRVLSDIRKIVRRDRNRPSVLLWEPILNETGYPVSFAADAWRCVKEEYPYPYCHTAADSGSPGQEFYDVIYSHPAVDTAPGRSCFTREWGDNVDDWSAHNSDSRVSRSWGEIPQLIQAVHYAAPQYEFTCCDRLYRTPDRHVGGCLWHATDHQRGYHPDPFYGGIMDAFRQPKYSYYMFMSQRPVEVQENPGSGPVVFIAHEMTPFSPADVTVYSNCDEVRLTVFRNGRTYVWHRPDDGRGMPSPVIMFKNAFSFMDCKTLARAGKQDDVYMVAEGFSEGRLVAVHRVSPSLRPEKLVLRADDEGLGLEAGGSDMVTVIAEVVDSNGNVKRLNNSWIRFSVDGAGEIVGADMRKVEWGSAPVLVRSAEYPGEIRVRASMAFPGTERPADAELVLISK